MKNDAIKYDKFYLNSELSNEDYHAEKEHLSSSNIKMILKDPKKFYKEKILHQKEDTSDKAVFNEGSYVHALILEPHTINKEFAFFNEWKKIGKKWKEFKELYKNKIILSKPQKKRCERMIENYNRRKEAVELMKGTKKELSLFLKLNDVPVKVRCDAINIDKKYIIDIKTTGYDTTLDSFKMTVGQFKYELSAALYLKAFEEYYKEKFDFYWIILGKNDDNCAIYKMSEDTRNRGMRLVEIGLEEYKRRVAENNWDNRRPETPLSFDSDYEIREI